MPLHALADDLLQLCLSCLDAHDLSRCTAVSTRLRQLASTDTLWRSHLQQLPGSVGTGHQLAAAPEAQGAAAAEASAAAVAPVPARLAFAAVSLLSAARLHTASAEARRASEKVLYNKVRYLSQQLRHATRRVDQSRSAQQAAAAERQQLLAEVRAWRIGLQPLMHGAEPQYIERRRAVLAMLPRRLGWAGYRGGRPIGVLQAGQGLIGRGGVRGWVYPLSPSPRGRRSAAAPQLAVAPPPYQEAVARMSEADAKGPGGCLPRPLHDPLRAHCPSEPARRLPLALGATRPLPCLPPLAIRPGGWSLQRPRSPPPAAAHARAEQARAPRRIWAL